MTFAVRLRSPWLWTIAAAWAFFVVVEFTGLSVVGDHHALIEGGRWPWSVSLVFFVFFWLLMVVAMMLPVNLPMLDALGGALDGPLATAAFFAGYFGIWTAYGAAVFVGDTGIHALTDSLRWLHDNEWVVLAMTLGVVGLFQLAPAKRRYLERCRRQAERVARRPVGGWMDALARGLRYGGCELSCCWALMLLVVAVGHSLVWTLAFTAIMLSERTLPRGGLLARLTGAVAVLCGAFVAANAL